MRLAFVGFQFAAIACSDHGVGKEFHRGERHRLILRAVEDNARRQPGADEMIRGNLLRTAIGAGADVGELFVCKQPGMTLHRRQHHGGVEQRESVRHGADFGVGSILEARHQSDRGGEMTTGGSTSSHNAVGVDAKTHGIGASPTHRRLRIAQAILRDDPVATQHPVVARDGDHAALREVKRLRQELSRRSAFPSASKEEQHRRTTIRGLMLRRREDVGVEFAAVDLAIDLHARAGHFRRIFPAHRWFGEVFGRG